MKKILIVDDDKEVRTNLAEFITEAGYEIAQAASGSEAVEKAIDEDFDVVLLDLVMPKMSGTDVIAQLRRVSPRSKVIMITAFATIENAVDAIKRGASDYVSKPFKIDDLLMRLKRVLEEARFEFNAEKGDLDAVLGALSNPIRRTVIQLISRRNTVRLKDLATELGVTDHTKALFHVKILKEAGIIEQGSDKSYSLSKEGMKALEGFMTFEKYLQK